MRLSLALLALGAALMAAAMVAWLTHRPPEATAYLYPPEDEDGVTWA